MLLLGTALDFGKQKRRASGEELPLRVVQSHVVGCSSCKMERW